MNHLSDEKSKSAPEGCSLMGRGSAKSGFMLFAGLALVLVGILSYFMLSRLNHIDQEVSQLRTQVQQANLKADDASAKAGTALDQASAAAENAQQAASERNQAEKAKNQFQQQAQSAQLQAAKAEAKAEQYRKQREAELDRLQQALGQIASTRRTAMGLVMTLGSKSIRFAFDKSTLRPEDKEVLSRIAGILSTLKGYQIYVYGYTDDIGSREYNQRLSERRANSVYDYLVHNGLDPKIMTTKGFGEADPLVKGNSAEARAINRRVEIGLVDSTIKPLSSQVQ
jgi:outer membrane protein OmpA-like peptidoglycan-associated protein